MEPPPLSKCLRVFIETEMDHKFSQVIHLVNSEIVKAMIEGKLRVQNIRCEPNWGDLK